MEEIELQAGETKDVTLPGLGSAGYQWFATVENSNIATVTKLEAVPGKITSGAASYGEVFSITALSTGETTAHFIQKRAFQSSQVVNATRDITIHIT